MEQDGNGGEQDGNGGDTPVDGSVPPAQVVQPPAEAPPEPVRDPRRVVAQHGYEMGLPLRTVGAQAGVTEASVRQWAKEEGWERGDRKVPPGIAKAIAGKRLTDTPPPQKSNVIALPGIGAPTSQTAKPGPCEVRSDAKCEVECEVEHDQPLDVMFRERVRQLLANPTRDEAADVAARAVVEVVRGHRRGIRRMQDVVTQLLGQLEIAADSREILEALICEETEPGKRRNAMLRLVSLREHAGTIKDLSTSMAKLVVLDRQAFGLAQVDDPTPPPEPMQADEVDDGEFARIRDRARARLAMQQALEGPK